MGLNSVLFQSNNINDTINDFYIYEQFISINI